MQNVSFILATDQETNFTPKSKRLIDAKINNKQKMEFVVKEKGGAKCFLYSSYRSRN